MKLYSESENYKLYHGDMLDMLEQIEEESIDCIITDPPYELNFMNKGWDNSGIAFSKETWKKCYKVLKPGSVLLAFGGTRTYHRIANAIERAGFEVKDTIMYLYGSGFPKSMNIGLAIDKKNGVDNRTGNIREDGKATKGNIYNCSKEGQELARVFEEREATNTWNGWGSSLKPSYEPIIIAIKPTTDGQSKNLFNNEKTISRYIYSAKACKRDRDEGLEEIEATTDNAKGNGLDRICEFCGAPQLKPELCKCLVKSWITKPKKNIHPTVKATNLMQELVKLVATPNATILDCFMGSGSTGKAVMLENANKNTNYKFIGIEMTDEYLPIAKARIDYAISKVGENK